MTSWLLDLTSAAMAKDENLSSFSGVVEDSGEGRWTVEAAIEEAVPAEVLAASLFVRFRSRQDHTFAEKVLSAMRFGFGGHGRGARERMKVRAGDSACRDGRVRQRQDHHRADAGGGDADGQCWRAILYHPPANVAKMLSAGTPLTDEDRWPWLHAIADAIDACRARDESAIVACSALRRAYRDILIGPRKDVRLVYLQGSEALIGERMRARKNHFMPSGLLTSQFATLEEPGA